MDFFKTLLLNGRQYNKSELRDLANKVSENTPEFKKELIDFIQFLIDENEKEIVVKTSGSTGTPKEISLKKSQLIASARATNNYLDLKKNDKLLLALPVKYIGGKMMVVRAFIGQLDLIVVKPENDIKESIYNGDKINFVAFTPTQTLNLLHSDSNSLEQFEKIIIGGAVVSSQLRKQLEKQKNYIFETYGMTETVSHVAIRKVSPYATSYFEAIPGVTFNVNSENCLVINAPHLQVYNLTTNDIVNLLSPEQFQIFGRKDNVINSGGLKIHPEVWEESLSEVIPHHFVIVPKMDDSLGQKAVLILELENQDQIQVQELSEIVKEKLSPGIYPKEIRFVHPFPKLPSGKIDRQELIRIIS